MMMITFMAVEQFLNLIYFLQYGFIILKANHFLKNIRHHFSLPITVLMLLLNYKFYSLLLFKLIAQKGGKHIRYRNGGVYQMHLTHLLIGTTMVGLALLVFMKEVVALNSPLRVVFGMWEALYLLAHVLMVKVTTVMLRYKKIRLKIRKVMENERKA